MTRLKTSKIIKWFVGAIGFVVCLNFLIKLEQVQTPGSGFDQTSVNSRSKLRVSENTFSDLKQVNGSFTKNDSNSSQNTKFNTTNYYLNLTRHRIERLFNTLSEKEKNYSSLMAHLGLIQFENVLNGLEETNEFMKVVNNRLTVTDEFINYLHNLSDFYSFKKPRINVNREKINLIFGASFWHMNGKFVIVTAANAKYYSPLQATLYHIHTHLPGHEIIVYDLGLDKEMHMMTVWNCRCRVIKFDPLYANTFKHIDDLMTYAWKPLLIQETLKSYESLIYIDSSIRFKTNEIGSQMNTLRDVGLLTQFIGLNFSCYTHPQMFKWFGEEPNEYAQFWTIEANILFFHRTFLTKLIMKAWVTCALDNECIAPKGSKVSPCCGCHRYDQAALTLVASFFYGHPREKFNHLPAYSFTTQESYFFSVNRYEGREYFTKPWYIVWLNYLFS